MSDTPEVKSRVEAPNPREDYLERISKRIANDFAYHPADSELRKQLHEIVRNAIGDCALSLAQVLPEGRETSTFLTKMEEAMFHANAAIARAGYLDDRTEDTPEPPRQTITDEELNKPF